jgi:hypothetical protein
MPFSSSSSEGGRTSANTRYRLHHLTSQNVSCTACVCPLTIFYVKVFKVFKVWGAPL